MAQIERDRPRDAGRRPHHRRSPACRSCQQANGSNFGSMFVILDPFDERQAPEPAATTAIMARLRRSCADGGQGRRRSTVFGAAADPGPRASPAGSSSWSRTAAASGLRDAAEADRRPDRQAAAASPAWSACSPSSAPTRPQLFLDIDRTKVAVAGRAAQRRQPDAADLPGLALRQQLQRVRPHWQVIVQAEGEFRDQVEDINLLQVRNKRGRWSRSARWSTSARSTARSSSRATTCTRPPPINGNVPPGVSSGEAIAAIDAAGRARRCRGR